MGSDSGHLKKEVSQPPKYPGDFDMNGKVDLFDWSYLANDWKGLVNTGSYLGDITGPNGRVDYLDVATFARVFLK